MNTMQLGRKFVFLGALVTALASTGHAASPERSSGAVFQATTGTTLGQLTPEQAAAAMTLPQEPPAAAALKERVSRPEELDPVSKELNIPARLVQFHLATPTDLSELGLGQATHLPVAISDSEGGRKSLYYLEPGEEVLAGFFVTNNGLALRYVKRESGEGVPAQTGDIYTERYTTREGRELFAGQGKLEVVDAEKGSGHVNLTQTPKGVPLKKVKVSYWHLWSCFRGEVEVGVK
ncbi:hypothetical protein HPC49_07170 [Pyxidicoccus fallax]|uniref:Lipoprotein n=1 Tax=Pyxidicoccus fallax TaxID=394095 RepID=A0A848LLX2_9BACT|nr:hypothetical protein [Pyxidicoccus fallax]NMO18827.1 hypothetical protein [Pyxidicoccus fallax]NPC78032.1 hypothetical protein [Pyxidicoccus fallax]